MALLGLVVVAAALAGPWRPPFDEPGGIDPEPLPAEAMPTLPTFEVFPVGDLEGMDVRPWNLTWLGFLLLGALVLWLVYLVMRWFRLHPFQLVPGPPDDAGILPGETRSDSPVPNLPSLRKGVVEADEQLRRHRTPAEAVIAAWVALEKAAARSGVIRDPAQTPTEFTVAVLDRTPADPGATRSLLGLYLRARFGGEYMSDRDVATATAALRALAEGLGVDEDVDPRPDPRPDPRDEP